MSSYGGSSSSSGSGGSSTAGISHFQDLPGAARDGPEPARRWRVSITDRDRKILLALIPLVAIIGYWFLLLAPKRQEASKVKDQLTQAEQVRDTAQQKASQLSGAKRSFAADYATVIRLGKSIPASVDMPSA